MDRRTKAIVIAAVALAVAAGAWVQYIDRDDGPDHPYLEITEEEKQLPPVDEFMEWADSEFGRCSGILMDPCSSYDDIDSAVCDLYTIRDLARFHYVWASMGYYADVVGGSGAYLEWKGICDSVIGTKDSVLESAIHGPNSARVEEVLLHYGITGIGGSSDPDWDARLNELYDETTLLEVEYQTLFAMEYTYTDPSGRVWTMDEAMYDPSLSQEESAEIVGTIFLERSTDLLNVYIDLIHVRTQIAQLHGYDNYIDYSFQRLNNRDYSLDDLSGFLENGVQMAFMYNGMVASMMEDPIDMSIMYFSSIGLDAFREYMEPFFEYMGGEIEDVWEYMDRCDLIHWTTDEGQVAIGCSFAVPTKHGSTIFISPDPGLPLVMFHEFGHSLRFCLSDGSVPIDVIEIHSQGMESLFAAYCLDRYDWGPDLCRYTVLAQSKAAVKSVSMTHMESWLYLSDAAGMELTPEMIAEEYERFQVELGFPLPDMYNCGSGYQLSLESNIILDPFYYIGYGTSGLNATEIFMTALEDPDAAEEMYLNLVLQTGDKGYVDSVTEAGLGNMLEKERIDRVMEWALEYVLGSSDLL